MNAAYPTRMGYEEELWHFTPLKEFNIHLERCWHGHKLVSKECSVLTASTWTSTPFTESLQTLSCSSLFEVDKACVGYLLHVKYPSTAMNQALWCSPSIYSA